MKTVIKNKTIKAIVAPPRRGRPKKQKPQAVQPIKKRRGRPPKSKEASPPSQHKKRRGRPPKSKEASPPSQHKKRRGRPPKSKEASLPAPTLKKSAEKIQLPVKKAVVKGPHNIIEDHPFYVGALWIQQNITPVEEAYLKRTANRHNTTVLYSILEHMLGYFSIHNSALGAALKEVKKPHTNN